MRKNSLEDALDEARDRALALRKNAKGQRLINLYDNVVIQLDILLENLGCL